MSASLRCPWPAGLALALALGASGAFAEPVTVTPSAAPAPAPAPADSSLERYVRAMSDSTDAYFGITAQLPDSAGLDSALTFGLAHPKAAGRPRGARLALGPALGFNRALGAVLGGSASIGRSRGIGRVTGTAQWANGPDLWLGGGRYVKRWAAHDDDGPEWRLEFGAGRHGEPLNRDHFDARLQPLYAFLSGSDRHHYLRRDGAEIALFHEATRFWAGAAWRDELESPLGSTATWTLFGARPAIASNVPAAFGRARELRANAGGRLPRVPVTLEAQWAGAGGPLGGDFEYSRGRLAAGGAFPLGTLFALTPQFEYGRITGDAPPQAAFWLGGGPGLRAMESQSMAGTGGASGGVDLILQDDVLHALHLRRPPTFPVQVGVFAGAGATGPRHGRKRRDIPDPRLAAIARVAAGNRRLAAVSPRRAGSGCVRAPRLRRAAGAARARGAAEPVDEQGAGLAAAALNETPRRTCDPPGL